MIVICILLVLILGNLIRELNIKFLQEKTLGLIIGLILGVFLKFFKLNWELSLTSNVFSVILPLYLIEKSHNLPRVLFK